MENLLCNEEWFNDDSDYENDESKRHRFAESSLCSSVSSKEYCEEAFAVFLEKEMSLMNHHLYLDRLINPNNQISIARSTAIHWFIQSRSRLNLCYGTVSSAANYLDRFVSAVQFNDWNGWVIELVAVSCLSIACKFGETELPQFHEIQMQGLDHTFETGLIQRMELSVLKVLDWRLYCTTPFCYSELMTSDIIELLVKPHLVDHLIDRLYNLLLFAILDCRFLEFRASVIALSALKCVLEELLIPSSMSEAHLSRFCNLIQDDQKENMRKCEEILRYKSRASLNYSNYPSTPQTVLLNNVIMEKKKVHICSAGKIDFSIFNPSKKKKV